MQHDAGPRYDYDYDYDAVGRLDTLTRQLAGAARRRSGRLTAADQSFAFAYIPASQIVRRTSSSDAFASNTAYDVSRAYTVNG